MRKIATTSVILALVACFALAAAVSPARAASEKVYVHLVVVPADPMADEATRDKLVRLEKAFSDLAGGFTQVGRTYGGSEHQPGLPTTETNVTYLVSAKRKIPADIDKMVLQIFGQKAFILVWEGQRGY